MRKLLASMAVASGLAISFAVPAFAAPPAQLLPPVSCNQGTMNAHESVPETTGTGATTPGHMAIPDSEEGPCMHGGEEG